ncbi:hypothetical protein M9Y10_028008 [Tritrichomonas musculus]|uniref:PAS domain-containing protein n=1 Tax=Tritrichomonas musculus TaxID=1915356 RepID=A0ABR2KIA9_9EUKA
MISPGERFDAFSSNRLIKKEDDAPMLGNNPKFILSPNKYSLFVFIHQLNRSITNIPWLFWIPTVITFIQFEASVFAPLNYHHWESIPQMIDVMHILEIILRYVPQSSSQIVINILFTIYSILIVAHFLLFLTIISLIRHKKDASIFIKIFFIYSYFILPFLRSSMICVISEEVTQIVRKSSFGSFFLSLFALIILLAHVFMIGFVQFSMGSSPSPNLINPLAIWGPCAWRSVLFELYISCLIIFLEFTRSIKNQKLFGILCIIVMAISIPHAVYQSMRTYFISYDAYEYINGLLWSMIAFGIFHLIQCFSPSTIPFWALLFVWLILPIIIFFVLKIITEYRLKKVRKQLDLCGTMAVPIDPKRDQEDFPNEVPLNSSVFDTLKIKTTRQAIFVARAACLISHSTFADLSLIRYFIERFPNGLFYFLHLVFLSHGLNQTQFQYVEKLINIYLDSQKKKIGILELCVFFQIITSIQESSNDIPQALVRELGKQKLQAMKCQQLLSKFWTSSCKGDITQMSRNAFALNKHVNDLNNSWKHLVMRYPYSLPIVNAYVEYLLTTGAQHRLADIIISNRPQVSEASSSSSSDPDMNVSILHQAIEDAVDRRPIISINKLIASLVISISIAIIFFLMPVIVSFVLVNKYSNYNDFVQQSVNFESTFSSIPNYFDDVTFLSNESTHFDDMVDDDEDINVTSPKELEARILLIKKTEGLANSLNLLLRKMPKQILKNSSETVHIVYLHFDLYNAEKESSYINTLRLASYFTQCLPFVPIDDPCVSLVMRNMLVTIEMMEETTIQAILNIEKTVNFYVKISPIFYVLNWALLIIVMVPLIYFSIKALKDEITYLLSIYLTIPRSTLIRFSEKRTGGSLTGVNPQEAPNGSLLMPSSFGNLQATGMDNNGVPLASGIEVDGNKNDGNENDTNVADAFKMLVNDHSNVNYSVLPKYFVLKTMIIFCFLVAMIAILSTVTCALFVSFSKSLIRCLYTQKVVADRSVGASIIMHGITSLGEDFSPRRISEAINKTGKLHTAILFKDSNYNLSNSALNQDALTKLQSGERCGDKSNSSCLSLVSLFDIFATQAISISNDFATSSDRFTNRSIDYFNDLRIIFNNELFPLLYETQQLVYDFTHDEIADFRVDIVIIIIVGCVTFVIVLMVFMLPTFREINMTIESVKLPLKHISPLDVADFQKILMYLQGECDFKRGGNNENGSESSDSNSVLNAMLSPFAIFENDLSLLFANNSFYSLLGTSRESSIGLPLADIFSIVLPFRNDENHPFNTLLNSISKMQQGEKIDHEVEVNTELEFQDIKSSPIKIRLAPIYKDDQQNEKEKKFHFDVSSKMIVKPSSYVIFIDDLSIKKELEQKIKFEEESSQKLISSSIPRSLSSLIQKGDTYEPRKFENIPIAMFSIKFNSHEDEFEDESLFACNLFVRTANDINHNFSRSVIKLIHDPPHWFYISNFAASNSRISAYSSNEVNLNNVEQLDSKSSSDLLRELTIELSDLLHFAISVIDVFNASSNKDYSLRVVVHVGQLSIVPLMLDLPMIEALGTGYQKLRNMSFTSKTGCVFCTSEVVELLKNENIFKFSQSLETGGDPLFLVKIENDHTISTDDQF